MSVHKTGRHRAPNNLNPVLSLSSAISRSAIPASKASAVMIMSGAMVASFALPASAATPTARIKTKIAAQAALADQAAVPSAAQAPLVPRTFGVIGFAGVVKPPPVPAPVVQQPVVVAVSRSTTRAPIQPVATQPAPVAAPAWPVSPTSTAAPRLPASTARVSPSMSSPRSASAFPARLRHSRLLSRRCPTHNRVTSSSSAHRLTTSASTRVMA